MAKSTAVVMSDIHIGDDSPTCWYQSKVHDPYFTRALKYVVDNKDEVRELILLGDVFDVWTYPPSVRPPGMKEILKANKKLLGPSGPLAAACKALPGEVRMILGNHDGTLTKADIELLNDHMGFTAGARERIQLLEKGIRFCEGAKGGKTIFSHGHFWCMFNAPDPDVPRWATLPIGHFVTRAIGYQNQRRLKPGKTVADLPNSGNPTDTDWIALINVLLKDTSKDIAPILLDYICKATGMKTTEKVVMPDGTTSSVDEAKKIYAQIYKRWLTRTGDRDLDVQRAALADKIGVHLGWFAQRLAMQYGADLVVFGHTHEPVGGFYVSPVNYFNSGYECVSTPDFKKKHRFTFTVIDLDLAGAEVWEVYQPKTGTFDVRPYAATPIKVVQTMDYSCYVRIENTSSQMLKRVGKPRASDGYWVVPPPQYIPPGKRADLWLQDVPGNRGSAGGFTYNDGIVDLDFEFACPFAIGDNAVTSPVLNWKSKVGSGPWRDRMVTTKGAPVQVRFTVEATTMARVPRRAPSAAVAGVY